MDKHKETIKHIFPDTEEFLNNYLKDKIDKYTSLMLSSNDSFDIRLFQGYIRAFTEMKDIRAKAEKELKGK